MAVRIPAPPPGERWITLDFFTREPGELTWIFRGLVLVPSLRPVCLHGCERIEIRRRLSSTAEVMARLRIGERTSPFSNSLYVATLPLAE